MANLDFGLFLSAKFDENQIKNELLKFKNIDLKINVSVDNINQAKKQIESSFKGISAPNIDVKFDGAISGVQKLNKAIITNQTTIRDAQKNAIAYNETIKKGALTITEMYKLDPKTKDMAYTGSKEVDTSKLQQQKELLSQQSQLYSNITSKQIELLKLQDRSKSAGENEKEIIKSKINLLNQEMATMRSSLTADNGRLRNQELLRQSLIQINAEKARIAQADARALDLARQANVLQDEKNRKLLREYEDRIRNLAVTSKGVMNVPVVSSGLSNLRTEMGNFDGSTASINRLAEAYRNYNMSVRESDRSMRMLERSSTTFIGTLGTMLKKFAEWITVSTIFMQGVRTIQDAVQTIISLDTAMIGLQKVTNETDETYANFLVSVNQMAKSLGHTTEAAINATTEFSKLGYSMKEAQELASTALIYSNIGDVDIAESTKSIISTLKGFRLEAREATNVIDKFNEVGNNFAISSGGIGEALQRAGASLSGANNTLEESIGLVVAANASVQDTSRVGNALKTVSMRLRGIADESGEAIPKLKELVQELSGVDIMENEDTFKSTYQIMLELSKVWDTLTDKNRASLLEAIAGKLQGTVVSSLLTNMTDGINATETALNSAGSAAAEQAKRMESITARLNVFTQTVTELWINMSNTGAMKGVIDTATAFVSVLTLMSKPLGGLPLIITAVVIGLSLFNKELALNKMLGGVWGAGISGNVASLRAWGATIDMVRIKQIALNAVIGLGFGIALSVLAIAVGAIIDHFVNYRKNLEQTFKASRDAVKSLTDDVSKADDAIKILKNTSSTTDELVEARKSLIDTMGSGIIEGYDLEGKAILKTNGYIEQQIELKKIELELAKEKNKINADKTQDQLIKDYEDRAKKIKKLQPEVEDGKNFWVSKEKSGVFYDYVVGREEELILLKQKQSQDLQAINENYTVYNSKITEGIQNELKLLSVKKDSGTLGDAELKRRKELLNELTELNKLSDKDFNDDRVQERIAELNKELGRTPQAFKDITVSAEDYGKSLDSLSSAYETVSKGEDLSVSSLTELIGKYPEVAEYIATTNDLTLKKGKILEIIATAENTRFKNNLEQELKMQETARLAALAFVEVQELKISAMLAVQNTYKAILGEEAKLPSLQVSDIFDPLGAFKKVTDTYKGEAANSADAGLKAAKDRVVEVDKGISKIKAELEILRQKGSGNILDNLKADKTSSQPNKINDYIDNSTKSFKNFEVQIQATVDEIEHYKKLMDSTDNLSDKQTYITKQNEAIERQKDLLHELADANRNALNESKKAFNDLGIDTSKIFNMGVTDSTGIEKVLGYNPEEYANFITKVEDKKNALIAQRVALNGKLSKSNGEDVQVIENKIKSLDTAIDLLEKNADGIKNARAKYGELNDELLKNNKLSSELSLKIILDDMTKQTEKLTSEFDALNDKETLLADNDYIGKAQILTERINLQEQAVKLAQEQFDALNNTTDEGVKSTDNYADELKKLESTLKDNTQELKLAKKAQDDLVNSNIEKYQKHIIDTIQEEIDDRKDLRDKLEKYYETKLTKMEDEYNKQKKINEENEKALEIEKAKQNLANVKAEKNTRVYTEGQGWIWDANGKNVLSAEENLANLIKQQEESDREKAYTKKKETLEKKKKDELDAFDTITKVNEDYRDDMEKLFDENGEVIMDYNTLVKSIPSAFAEANPKIMKELSDINVKSEIQLSTMRSNLQKTKDLINEIDKATEVMLQKTSKGGNTGAQQAVIRPATEGNISKSGSSSGGSNLISGIIDGAIKMGAPIINIGSSIIDNLTKPKGSSQGVTNYNINGDITVKTNDAKGFMTQMNNLSKVGG